MDMFSVIIIVEVILAFWNLGSKDGKHLTLHRAVLISTTCLPQMSIVTSVTKNEVESIYLKNYVSVLHGIIDVLMKFEKTHILLSFHI